MTKAPLTPAETLGSLRRQRREARRLSGGSTPVPDPVLLSKDAGLEVLRQCKTTLGFARTFWPVVEPDRDFVNGWHVGCVAEHLDAVSDLGSDAMTNLIINIPPRCMKPVWTGAPVLMADGTTKPLGSVCVGDRVIGWTGKAATVTAVHSQGRLPTVRIITGGGRQLVCAPDHPVLTWAGWVAAGKLAPGDVVGVADAAGTDFSARAGGDAYPWETVRSVSPAGVKRCACLTVPGEDSFVASGVVVHNSLLTCVFWFGRVWTERPGTRWMFASFNQELIHRDSDRCRDIVKHPLYRRLWDVRVKGDQDTRGKFSNQHQGFRACVTTRGAGGMGEGADFLVVDDPQNPRLAASEVERANTIHWYRTTFSRRGNDERTVRKVIIMQRLTEGDLTGWAMSELTGCHQLVLPMRYEPARYFLPDAGGGAVLLDASADADEPEVPPEAVPIVPPTPAAKVAVTAADIFAAVAPATPTAPEPAAVLPPPRPTLAEVVSKLRQEAAEPVPVPEAGGVPVNAAPDRPRDAIIPTPLQLARPHLMDGPTGSGRAEEGDLLWPERFPEWAVAKAEEELGQDAAGQYAQRPTGASGDIFTSDSFRYYVPRWDSVQSPSGVVRQVLGGVTLNGPEDGQARDFQAGDVKWFQTIDTAMSEKKRAAFTAVLTFGITPEFDLILWHAFRGRVGVQYQYPLLAALRNGPAVWRLKTHEVVPSGRWPFRVLIQAVEEKASGVGLIQTGMSEGNPFHTLTADKDKVTRAVPVSGLYARGKVYHPNGKPKWLRETESELLSFPNGRWKDVADCVAYAGILATRDRLVRTLVANRVLADVPEDADERDETRDTVRVAGGEVDVDWGGDDPYLLISSFFGQ